MGKPFFFLRFVEINIIMITLDLYTLTQIYDNSGPPIYTLKQIYDNSEPLYTLNQIYDNSGPPIYIYTYSNLGLLGFL